MAKQANLLRDYQQDIVIRVRKAWKHHRSVMVQMPTGTGKTHVLANIVNEELRINNEECGSILIVAHRVELIAQIKETIHKLNIGQERIRIESIQTVARRIESLDFTPNLIIIDEAHHALAKTYRILWEKWPQAKFLGLTATPCRMNRSGFKDLFEVLVTSWSIAEFIERRVLSAFDYVSIRPNSLEQRLIDSLGKRSADGDYQVKEMDEVLNKRPSIERLYRSMMQFAEGKKGIVYAISRNHAHQIAAYYSEQGVKAVAIDSQTPREQRKKLVESFKEGSVKVLVNVDVFSEGFDCPDVEFVQMARPTLSLAKYLQQVGRGLRKTEGKVSCMLIDNVGLYRVFGLPVVAWDWEEMFLGKNSGKGRTEGCQAQYAASMVSYREVTQDTDMGIELVMSHADLLNRLHELDQRPTPEQNTAELRAWQDKENGLWGLKQGREKVTEARYVTVFDTQGNLAAVRLGSYECGLVDKDGSILWKQKGCLSMEFLRNRLMLVKNEGGKEWYVDLCNLKTYESKPEIKRYGKFELLKVRNTCYSRTKRLYASQVDFGSISITDRGFMLTIHEFTGKFERENMITCILDGDAEEYYVLKKWMADGSAIIHNNGQTFYHIHTDGKKTAIEWHRSQKAVDLLTKIDRMDEEIRTKMEAEEKEKKRRILEKYRSAIPYQAGMKWGLKAGDRIIVPPIYRNVKPPIGKYCAVEKNYCQWGIISIDGTILIDPKYPDVSIEENGTAWLTQVTGKKVMVKLV